MSASSRIVVFVLGAFVREKDGAHARVLDMLDRFHAEGLPVTVYSYRDHVEYTWTSDDEARFGARWPDFELTLEDCPRYVGRAVAVKKLLCSVFPARTAQILSVAMPGTPKWAALKASGARILVHYAAGLFQLNGVQPSDVIVETLDLNFLKSAIVGGKSAISSLGLLNLRWEMAALSQVDSVIAISPPETDVFRLLLPAIKLAGSGHVPDIHYVSAWSKAEPLAAVSSPTAILYDFLFVGSAYQMNARGLVDLFARHGAWLGNYRVAVAGRVCEDAGVQALARAYPKITLIGYVDDLSGLYRDSRIALAPVEGTGVKIKVTQALSFGLPVMASLSAVEGLAPGYEGAVFNIARPAAERLLSNPKAFEAARVAVRRYHQKRTASVEADRIVAKLKRVDYSVVTIPKRRSAKIEAFDMVVNFKGDQVREG